MTDRDLDRAVAEHYAGESLPPETLERLLAQAERARSGGGRRRVLTAVLALAATVVLGVALGRTLRTQREDRDPTLLARAVAAEILSHEEAGRPVQYRGASLELLQGEMPKLDFRLAAPRRLEREGFAPVGARYCSLRGGLAAQIRLRDAAGRFRNVYLCPVRARLAALAVGEVHLDGSRVVLWKEGGLLYGMRLET